MSVNIYDKENNELKMIAGGTLYADAPIGTVISFGGSVVPNGYLLCNGQAVNRATYPQLFAVIGTTYGSGNGTTTFNVPNLRDKAVMGAGTNGVLGETQSAQLPNITGKIDNKSGTFGIMGFSSSTSNFSGALVGSEAKGAVYTGQQNTSACKVVTFDASHSGASTDVNGNNVYTNNGETRPANVRLNYIIKAKSTPVPTDFSDSFIGYLGGESDYNLYPWSHTRTMDGADDSQDVTIERDGWYSIDYTLTNNSDAQHSFTFRDFDSLGEVHTIIRFIWNKSGTIRQTFLVPLKAGTYRYSHGGIGTVNVYMNRRDFA